MSGWFQPNWLRIAALVAVIIGIAVATWLFGVLATPT